MHTLFLYLTTTVIFFAVDMLWIGFIARNFYSEKLAFVFTGEVNWPAAIIFYLFYIAGILYFAVTPALKGSQWQLALLNGAILGGLCYATYDLTNMATIKQWPLIVVVVDIAWGIVLTGSVSVLSYLAATRFGLSV
ncbi:MAG: DUF2177 family protein [Bacteroidetes bacterium]|nr:DUF2177 family protein [Bacteroidota bacterium]